MTVINPTSKNIGGLVDGATDVKILSGSKANSEGVTIIDQGLTIYIPNTIDDKKSIIDQQSKVIDEIVKIIDQQTSVLSDINTAMQAIGTIFKSLNTIPVTTSGGAGTAGPIDPGFTADATLSSQISNINSQLNQIKTDTNQIKTDNTTLKNNLK